MKMPAGIYMLMGFPREAEAYLKNALGLNSTYALVFPSADSFAVECLYYLAYIFHVRGDPVRSKGYVSSAHQIEQAIRPAEDIAIKSRARAMDKGVSLCSFGYCHMMDWYQEAGLDWYSIEY